MTNADLSSSISHAKSTGSDKDSAGRSGGAANRPVGSARPVRDAIATVKKAVDRIADRIADRVSRQATTKADTSEGAET